MNRRHKPTAVKVVNRSKPLIVGFLPENDCAPIVIAQEMGFFRKYGLDVELQREMSWKNIHDKIIHRQIHAGQAPAALPFLIHLGLTPEQCDCISGMVLSLQGNSIAISKALWNRGVRDALTLRELITQDRGRRTYSFGVSCPLASPYVLLCQWLRSADIPPGVEVRIVPGPASQMFPMLKLGYLDGYCAGEPWGTLAVQAGEGVCVTTSTLLAPLHPEKVLLVRKDFAQKNSEQHELLIAALLEACCFCDQPQNRNQLCDLLALPHYVNAPVECLEAGLVGQLAPDQSTIHPLHGLHIFHHYNANEPTSARAAWITGRLYEFFRWDRRPASLDHIFRPDIFRRAEKLRIQSQTPPPINGEKPTIGHSPEASELISNP